MSSSADCSLVIVYAVVDDASMPTARRQRLLAAVAAGTVRCYVCAGRILAVGSGMPTRFGPRHRACADQVRHLSPRHSTRPSSREW